MHSRYLIPLLCAGALALACGSFSHSDASLVPGEKTVRHRKDSPTHLEPKIDGVFAVQIEAHALRFALDVTNRSKRSVELSFPNGQEYDFAVVDSVGREVYRWGSGRMFTQSVQNRTIGGRETLRIGERAITTLPRGSYYAVATLRSSNFPLNARTTFRLR